MRKKIENIGETRLMNCGMWAEIIEWRNNHDIDVEFEDGVIKKHIHYQNFYYGEVKNEKCPKIMKKQAKERLNQTNIMKNGMSATIIRYGSSIDIDVQFEDGKVAKHKRYNEFLTGQIGYPSHKKPHISKHQGRSDHVLEREGQTLMQHCGQKATIIKYHNSTNIDVEFEDGTVILHRTYNSFLNGSIKNPSMQSVRLGETRIMNCGLEATIIKYYSYNNITIQFEDGVKKKNVTYESFKYGNVKHEGIKTIQKNRPIISKKNLKNERLNETKVMKNGKQATIIGYRSCLDIDVQFDNGFIREHTTYQQFQNGSVYDSYREHIRHKYTDSEIILIKAEIIPDEDLAKMIGVSQQAIEHKRRRIQEG